MSATTEVRPAEPAVASVSYVPSDRLAAPSIDLNPNRRPSAQTVAAPPAAGPAEVDHEAFLADAFAAYVDAETSLPRYIARHPRLIARVLHAITTLPTFDAQLPTASESAAVQRLLLEHRTTRRIMLGVSAALTVPTEPGTYTDGRDRATVRRKIRAAEKQSITVRAVQPEERAALLALANRHELTNERAEYRIEQPDNDDLLDYALWLVALDGDGQPIMLSVTPTAGEWGVLRYFRTLAPGQASSDARYLMARELAETLCTRGVRYLVDSSRPHWLPNGLRHFQRMIGFRLVRVRKVRITER